MKKFGSKNTEYNTPYYYARIVTTDEINMRGILPFRRKVRNAEIYQ